LAKHHLIAKTGINQWIGSAAPLQADHAVSTHRVFSTPNHRPPTEPAVYGRLLFPRQKQSEISEHHFGPETVVDVSPNTPDSSQPLLAL